MPATLLPSGAKVVMIGNAVIGHLVTPTRSSRLRPVQARAAVRLTELARLASWRGRFGVLSDTGGWATVAADCLAELHGTGEWRCDEAGIVAQLPPGTGDADAIAAALTAPRRPGRLFSNREAGRLVELVRLEADDPDLCGPITTLTARDIDDAELAQRRLTRRREGARERKRRARAKCVTPKNVTNSVHSNVTLKCHTTRYTMTRDAHRVTNGSASHEITAETVAAALAIKPGAARARLMRWRKAGVIQQACRGRYAVPVDGGGPAAPPLPPAPGRQADTHSGDKAAHAGECVEALPWG
jgi:hypothetical protein